MYRLNDKFGRFDQRLTKIKVQNISALNPNYSNKSYFFVILATASIISFATFSASASVAASE
jgi:hypothetical protein